jgi:2-dehydro-3-deoxyphosphogluconate aldolase/(4S)-4-hydroxy-2-oxoglutarate aldolase
VKKADVLARLRTERILAFVSADIGADIAPCARALSAGGINSLELAMTTPAALANLEKAAAALPDFQFGLGTVLDVDTARLAILAGASFIATPSPRPAVITLCRRYNVPVVSGAFASADIVAAHAAGADLVKVFPGELFGPAYLRKLKEEFPAVGMIPIGGVTPATIAEFLRVGVVAAIAGSSLVVPELLAQKNWAAITRRAREFTGAIASATA